MNIPGADSSRPTYTYQVPPKLAAESEVASVTLVHLTAAEEIGAAKKAGGTDAMRLAQELAKACLWGINGKTLSHANSEKEIAWHKLHPKLRALVLSAYGKLHSPETEDVDSFLRSEVVEAS
jgi:hypothetical protein